MRRLTILITTLFLFAVGAALAAATPVDYSLVCATDAEDMTNVEVIGVATEVGGRLHVRLVDGWLCDAQSSVVLAVALHDTSVVFDVTVDELDGAFTLTFSHDGVEGLSGEATSLPQQAIDGMANAHALRTAAFENRMRGAETSAAAREAAGVAGRPESVLDDDEGDEEADRRRPERPVTPASGRP